MKTAYTQIYGGEAVYYQMERSSPVCAVVGMDIHCKKNILYAYLPLELAKTGTPLEVDLIEGRYPGKGHPDGAV